jgi:hypothetical protein
MAKSSVATKPSPKLSPQTSPKPRVKASAEASPKASAKVAPVPKAAKGSPKAPPSLNREWHEVHRMPPDATLEQRIAWHRAHAAACGCRPAPASIQRFLRVKSPA